jgi:DnaJ-class molecular chaperone
MFQRCHVCRGQKKVRGLGCLLKKCDVCGGTGYIESETEAEQELETVETVETVQKVDVEPKLNKKKKSHWSKKDAKA